MVSKKRFSPEYRSDRGAKGTPVSGRKIHDQATIAGLPGALGIDVGDVRRPDFEASRAEVVDGRGGRGRVAEVDIDHDGRVSDEGCFSRASPELYGEPGTDL